MDEHGHAQHRDKGPTPTYNAWAGMWQRCTNLNNPKYHRYGARGIVVCEEWEDFKKFLADMGEAPRLYVLDRRDNDKGYNKENCRWVTREVSAANKSIPPANNKSGMKGVHYLASRRRWVVWGGKDYKTYVGTYTTREQALAAMEHFNARST